MRSQVELKHKKVRLQPHINPGSNEGESPDNMGESPPSPQNHHASVGCGFSRTMSRTKPIPRQERRIIHKQCGLEMMYLTVPYILPTGGNVIRFGFRRAGMGFVLGSDGGWGCVVAWEPGVTLLALGSRRQPQAVLFWCRWHQLMPAAFNTGDMVPAQMDAAFVCAWNVDWVMVVGLYVPCTYLSLTSSLTLHLGDASATVTATLIDDVFNCPLHLSIAVPGLSLHTIN